MMKSYQHFLFDWDGCLGKTLDVWLDGYRETYREFQLPQSDREITLYSFNNQNGPSERGIDDQNAFMDALIKRVDKGLRNVETYPGAKELVSTIKAQGNSVSLVTSSPRPIIHDALAKNDMTQLFAHILTGDDVTHHKPHPEVITATLTRLEVTDYGSAIIIGDSKSDLGAAKNAGIDSILFFPPNHQLFYDISTLKEYYPTHIFDSFDAIHQALS